MVNRKWLISTISVIVILILAVAGVTIYIDPFFHYHKPLDEFSYPMKSERYINDGITRNFEYDALITGSSLVENFKTSEMDSLFGVNSIKIPYPGATYKEIGDAVARSCEYNKDIKYVVRGLDYMKLVADKDSMRYDSYPDYLYDNNIINDVHYVLNKEILFDYTLEAKYVFENKAHKELNFDEYANTMEYSEFGKEAILKTYERAVKSDEEHLFTEEDEKELEESICQNILANALDNPDVEFYLFFPPYSIYYWDSINQEGRINKMLDTEKRAIEMMLQVDNIRLFSFFDEFEMICDTDNYKDMLHYHEDINSYILYCMKNGEHELTIDNYEAYCESIREFYASYDYDSLFE